MALLEIHEMFKVHILNELRVSFNKTMKKEIIIPPKEPNKTISRRYVNNI